VLVVAAHPDDEVLGCGGTISRHAEAGDEISILILGEGMTSRRRTRQPKRWRKELNHLHRDAEQAALVLGARSFHENLPDNRFDSIPLLDIIKIVETVKSKVAPAVVYTHHGGDLNIDHRITFQAVLTAFRPQPGEAVRAIYAFEVPSSTEWQGMTADGIFRPTTYVDISSTLAKKLEAMEAYKSEIREYPHPRSIRALELIARKNGVEVGMEAAERFTLIRSLL
jgi:LmbE family N-acetylglucosaminyl deacetylase